MDEKVSKSLIFADNSAAMSESATMEAEIAATAGSPVKKVDNAEPAQNGDAPSSSATNGSPSKGGEK